jgi:two-component system, OmpR family, phosphate regulon sensor histidine kinase PhoR
MNAGLTPGRLRLFLALLFLALAVPSVMLIRHTQAQLKWQAFHQYRVLAVELARRIDAQLQRMIDAEEAHGFADYTFVVIAGDPNTSRLVQRSPLARYPVQSELAGVIGHFQVGADGRFSTPLLPADPAPWRLDADEFAQRSAKRRELIDVLVRHQLLDAQTLQLAEETAAAQAEAGDSQAGKGKIAAQAVFDGLNMPMQQAARVSPSAIGRVEDLRQQNFPSNDVRDAAQRLAPAPEAQPNAGIQARSKRMEQAAIIASVPPAGSASGTDPARVHIFQSEVDPFEFSLLDTRHAVLYRKVWRHGERTIQGALIDWNAFLDTAIVAAFEGTALAEMSDMAVAYQHDVVRFARSTAADSGGEGGDAMRGELLHQARLSAPLGDVLLLWNIDRLPTGGSGRLVLWTSAVLLTVLVLGFVLLYRLGMRQILLTRQQQDFVSAVSHELNTPLTSIRMYAEMLEAGWVGDEKKREYYAFIHDESQRLSRLIANVLRLARMEREALQLNLRPIAALALCETLRTRLGWQIERAGFIHQHDCADACADLELVVDRDAVLQIAINLVDNALKFAARADCRRIEIGMRPQGDSHTMIYVRDHGPGVERRQMRKIFTLFYRPGNELTRETPGTGIGLALARQLARAMGGDVDVVNRDPGAEFQLLLPSRALPNATDAIESPPPPPEE